MTHVVAEPCFGCKYTDCVVVCPMECFYGDEQQLYIDPDDCIDCGLCISECPVDAICTDAEVPAEALRFIAINAELARQWPEITRRKSALPNAAQWAQVHDKGGLLDPQGGGSASK